MTLRTEDLVERAFKSSLDKTARVFKIITMGNIARMLESK
jgi:hypothetical protein